MFPVKLTYFLMHKMYSFFRNLSESPGFISKQILIDLFSGTVQHFHSYSSHTAGTKFDVMKESKRPNHV